MSTPKIINEIYFDEVSDTVDDWLTTYLNFDNVDLTIKPSRVSVTFVIKYRGRGSYVLENGLHASTQLDYGWYISLIGSKLLLEEGVGHYQDVSVSIKKNLFSRRKITVVFNGEKRKGLVFYGRKVILTKLVSEDATYNDLQQSKKKSTLKPTTNILLSPRGKEKLVTFLREIGQIKD